MDPIHLDPAHPFQVQFVANLPLNWQVIRTRNGVDTVIVHGTTTAQPPPPPDVAQVPAGQFQASDTLTWAADLSAPVNASANYTLNVVVLQSGKTLAKAGPVNGTIPANGDDDQTGSFACT